jgi:hypothetical protein
LKNEKDFVKKIWYKSLSKKLFTKKTKKNWHKSLKQNFGKIFSKNISVKNFGHKISVKNFDSE